MRSCSCCCCPHKGCTYFARSAVTSLSLLLISLLDKAPLYALHTRSLASFSCAVRATVRASERGMEGATKDDRQPWPRMRGTWLDSQSGGLADGRTEWKIGWMVGWLVRQEYVDTDNVSERTSAFHSTSSPSSL